MNFLVRWSPFYNHRGWHIIGPIAYFRLLWRRFFWRPDLLPVKPTAQAYATNMKQLEQSIATLGREFARDEDIAWAHATEDRIRESVLRAISEGTPNPIELATAALQTGMVEFNRGYK